MPSNCHSRYCIIVINGFPACMCDNAGMGGGGGGGGGEGVIGYS